MHDSDPPPPPTWKELAHQRAEIIIGLDHKLTRLQTELVNARAWSRRWHARAKHWSRTAHEEVRRHAKTGMRLRTERNLMQARAESGAATVADLLAEASTTRTEVERLRAERTEFLTTIAAITRSVSGAMRTMAERTNGDERTNLLKQADAIDHALVDVLRARSDGPSQAAEHKAARTTGALAGRALGQTYALHDLVEAIDWCQRGRLPELLQTAFDAGKSALLHARRPRSQDVTRSW